MRVKFKYFFLNYLFICNVALFEFATSGHKSNNSSVNVNTSVKQIESASTNDQRVEPSLDEILFFQAFQKEFDSDDNANKSENNKDEDGDSITINDDEKPTKNYRFETTYNIAKNNIEMPVSRSKMRATQIEIIQNPGQTLHKYMSEHDPAMYSDYPHRVDEQSQSMRYLAASSVLPTTNEALNIQPLNSDIAHLNPTIDATVAEFLPPTEDAKISQYFYNGHSGAQTMEAFPTLTDQITPQPNFEENPTGSEYLKNLEQESEKKVEEEMNDRLRTSAQNDTTAGVDIDPSTLVAMLNTPSQHKRKRKSSKRTRKYNPLVVDAGVMINKAAEVAQSEKHGKDLEAAAGEKHEEHKEKKHEHEHWKHGKKHWHDKHKKDDHHHKKHHHKEGHWDEKEHKKHHHKKKGHHDHKHEEHKHEHKHKHKGHKEHWHHDKGGGWEKHWHWDKAEGHKEHWDEKEHKKKHHEKEHEDKHHHHEEKKDHHHHHKGHHDHKHKEEGGHWKDHGDHKGHHHHHHHHKEHKHHHHHHKHHKDDDHKDHWHR